MPNVPRFKTLRPYKDPVSAREWNWLTSAVAGLCRSLGTGGMLDSSGLHIRPSPRKHWPAFYRICANDGEGRYTLRPQVWNETQQEFANAEGADDADGYEITGRADCKIDEIVRVRAELSLEGRWIALFMSAPPAFCWGIAKDDWQSGNVVELTPCNDEQGSNPKTAVTVTAYVITPIDKAPDDCDVEEGDVLAYLPFGDGKGVLVNALYAYGAGAELPTGTEIGQILWWSSGLQCWVLSKDTAPQVGQMQVWVGGGDGYKPDWVRCHP